MQVNNVQVESNYFRLIAGFSLLLIALEVCFAQRQSVKSVGLICYGFMHVKIEINKSRQQWQAKEKSMMQKLPKAGGARLSIFMHNVIWSQCFGTYIYTYMGPLNPPELGPARAPEACSLK